MAQQQQFIIGEFIEKVKKRNLKRDSPYSYDQTAPIASNRGNKLNRNARYVHEGRLNNSTLFKQKIEHAGYQRNIISVNPPYYTPEGDIIEDESEIDDDDETLEENIYKDIRLEELLAPLTSAAELPTHPSLSRPYKERGLQEMIKNAEEMLHQEQRALWKAKRLFTELRGDSAWAPVGLFHSAIDDQILGNHRLSASSVTYSLETQDPTVAVPLASAIADVELPAATSQAGSFEGIQEEDARMTEGEVIQDGARINGTASAPPTEGVTSSDTADHVTANGDPPRESQLQANGTTAGEQDVAMSNSTTAEHNEDAPHSIDVAPDASVSMDDGDSVIAPSHRMTTRAQANQTTRSPSPRSLSPVSSLGAIHPFFQYPTTAIPDTNLGLPHRMADEANLALTTYISKKEEIVRSLKELHLGLLKAMEMRTNVWNWTKAEGHVGEMSDNEDWVDLEEWGIDPRDTRIKYTKGQQEDEQADEEEERRGKRVRRVGRSAKD